MLSELMEVANEFGLRLDIHISDEGRVYFYRNDVELVAQTYTAYDHKQFMTADNDTYFKLDVHDEETQSMLNELKTLEEYVDAFNKKYANFLEKKGDTLPRYVPPNGIKLDYV